MIEAHGMSGGPPWLVKIEGLPSPTVNHVQINHDDGRKEHVLIIAGFTKDQIGIVAIDCQVCDTRTITEIPRNRNFDGMPLRCTGCAIAPKMAP